MAQNSDEPAVLSAGGSLSGNTSRTQDETTQNAEAIHSEDQDETQFNPETHRDPESERDDGHNNIITFNPDQQKEESHCRTDAETEDDSQKTSEPRETQDETTQNAETIHSEDQDETRLNPKTHRDPESERDGGHERRTEVMTEENPDSSLNPDQQKEESHCRTDAETEDDSQKTSEPRETQDEPAAQSSACGPPQTQRRVKSNEMLWIAAALLVLGCAVLYQYVSDSPPQVPKEFNVVDVFNENMEKVKSSFPNQRAELWRRSRIHLSRHLKTTCPTEPVSLILTSGRGAERTLGCLAQRLANAFSAALNSSVLDIYGKNKASEDSDQVKLDIDRDLRKAFGGEKLAAVIHRIEELPPGSTLIFYRYCDHENAAYKKVFLVFTVMLDAENEIPANVTLARVEDMVHEQLKQKFVTSEKSSVFNQMDVDKLSGLWSRISHLILPVAAEKKIEKLGCGSEG